MPAMGSRENNKSVGAASAAKDKFSLYSRLFAAEAAPTILEIIISAVRTSPSRAWPAPTFVVVFWLGVGLSAGNVACR